MLIVKSNEKKGDLRVISPSVRGSNPALGTTTLSEKNLCKENLSLFSARYQHDERLSVADNTGNGFYRMVRNIVP
jgi:hypothetical protein